MERLFEIYKELYDASVTMFNQRIQLSGGAPAAIVEVGDAYGLFIDTDQVVTFRQELVVAAHEWAHITTGSTHHVNSSSEQIAKDECKAHRAMLRKLVPLRELRRAAASGCEEAWQFSEFLDLPEEIMHDALEYWTVTRGEKL